MKRLLVMILVFIGALVLLNAWTDLDLTTVGYVWGQKLTGSVVVAAFLAVLLSGKSK